jgi:hypothetical protein
MGEWLSLISHIQNIKYIREIIYVPNVLLNMFWRVREGEFWRKKKWKSKWKELCTLGEESFGEYIYLCNTKSS